MYLKSLLMMTSFFLLTNCTSFNGAKRVPSSNDGNFTTFGKCAIADLNGENQKSSSVDYFKWEISNQRTAKLTFDMARYEMASESLAYRALIWTLGDKEKFKNGIETTPEWPLETSTLDTSKYSFGGLMETQSPYATAVNKRLSKHMFNDGGSYVLFSVNELDFPDENRIRFSFNYHGQLTKNQGSVSNVGGFWGTKITCYRTK